MDLIVDGYIYQVQTRGGISRIYDNILPRMCELDTDLNIQIFNNTDLAKQPPQHMNISNLSLNKYDKFIRPGRIWRRAYPSIHNRYLQLLLGTTKGKIWFSTYYSVPPFNWNGDQIVFAHDFIYEMYSNLFPDSEKIIEQKKISILNGDAIICISHSTANDLVKYYPVPENKIFIAELGYDPIFSKRSNDLIKNKIGFPFILYIGQRKHYKGFDTLLAAFSKWKKNQDFKLVVVGPPWSSEELDLITENKLQNQIKLMKGIDDDQLSDLYNQAKAFIYPSLYEGFGIPLLEAMACNCPIVASEIPSTLEIAKDIPYYFEPGNVESLLTVLDEAVKTSNGKHTKKNNQSNLILSQYSWDRTAHKVLNIIKTVSGKNMKHANEFG